MKRRPKRLDAFLARAGLGSRSAVKRLIARGRVRVDGVVCKRPETPIVGREVTFNSESVELLDLEHVLLYKPVGYACSHNPNEAPIIAELLPPAWVGLGLEPAGRLDRETSGLLVLSNDGGLIHRLTTPRRKLPKRYRITYSGALPEDAVARCAAGIDLGSGETRLTRPAVLAPEGPGRATLILYEGRNRQARRMLAALGTKVETLHRDRIGGLDLPEDLAPGEARPLAAGELELLLLTDQ